MLPRAQQLKIADKMTKLGTSAFGEDNSAQTAWHGKKSVSGTSMGFHKDKFGRWIKLQLSSTLQTSDFSVTLSKLINENSSAAVLPKIINSNYLSSNHRLNGAATQETAFSTRFSAQSSTKVLSKKA